MSADHPCGWAWNEACSHGFGLEAMTDSDGGASCKKGEHTETPAHSLPFSEEYAR